MVDEEKKTAVGSIFEIRRRNLRYDRAMRLSRLITNLVRHHIEISFSSRRTPDVPFEYELLELLMGKGAELVTDEMRADAGLPPRDGNGWTNEEMIAMEERHLAIMRAPLIFQTQEK